LTPATSPASENPGFVLSTGFSVSPCSRGGLVNRAKHKEEEMNDIKGADLLLVNGFLLAARLPEQRERLAFECSKLMKMVKDQHMKSLQELEEVLSDWIGSMNEDPSADKTDAILCDLLVRCLALFPVEMQAKTGADGSIDPDAMWAVPKRITIEELPTPSQNPAPRESSGTSPNLEIVRDTGHKEVGGRLSEGTTATGAEQPGTRARMCSACGLRPCDTGSREFEDRQFCNACNWMLH
jgi:hypothetical protein